MFNISNITINNNINDQTVPGALKSAEICILSMLMAVIIVGNILAVLGLLYVKEMKTITGLFLLNLASADLAVGLLNIPSSLVSRIDRSAVYKKGFCYASGCCLVLFYYVSLLTLTAISIQQYIQVVLNAKTRFTRKHTFYSIIGVWILSIIIAIGPILGWAEYTYTTGGYQCAPHAYDAKGYSYIGMMLFFGFLMPVSVLAYCYLKLYFYTRNYMKIVKLRAKRDPSKSIDPRKSVTDTLLIHTLIIVIFVCVFCWLPVAIFFMLKVARIKLPVYWEGTFLTLAYAKSGLNPIIYALRHKAFRIWIHRKIQLICTNRVANENVNAGS